MQSDYALNSSDRIYIVRSLTQLHKHGNAVLNRIGSRSTETLLDLHKRKRIRRSISTKKKSGSSVVDKERNEPQGTRSREREREQIHGVAKLWIPERFWISWNEHSRRIKWDQKCTLWWCLFTRRDAIFISFWFVRFGNEEQGDRVNLKGPAQ